MFDAKKRNASGLVTVAVAVAMAFGGGATPAAAQGGDITKGLLLGLVGGYAVNQYIQHQRGAQTRSVVSYPSYVQQPTTPVTYQQPPSTAPSFSHSSPDSRAFSSEDRQVRIAIQYNLMQAGFYNGALDGIWGPATEDAVFHYARAHDQVAMLATEDGSRQLFSSILR